MARFGPLREVAPGVSYADVLKDPDEPLTTGVLRSVLGLVFGLGLFVLVAPLVAYAVLGLAWALSGSPGDFPAFQEAGQRMEFPAGMLAAHLGLVVLIPIAFGLVVKLHRVPGRWLSSVQPGFRWRFAIVCFLVAAGVLNLGLLVSRGFTVGPLAPQADWAWFLVVIVLTSPLQAAAEEFFFRGYLLSALTGLARNKWLGVLLSALVFAAFHGVQNVPMFCYRFGFGLVAGALVVLTGGLEAGIAAHVVNNLCSFGYATLGSSVAAVIAVKEISWVESGSALASFAAFAALAWLVGRRMRVATLTPSNR